NACGVDRTEINGESAAAGRRAADFAGARIEDKAIGQTARSEERGVIRRADQIREERFARARRSLWARQRGYARAGVRRCRGNADVKSEVERSRAGAVRSGK